MPQLDEKTLEIVARHLQEQAEARANSSEGDLFGRSAFNRYYYATYLEVRYGLGKLQDEWSGDMPHATIPQVLRGQVVKALKNGYSLANKNNDREAMSLCSDGITAAKNLAELMEKGRGIRVAADYHPEITVDFKSHVDFKLNTVEVSDARSWPARARGFVSAITQAWRQVI
ncbi:hypothetical protein ACO0K7_01955 [Undibacterium sp. Ji67W]|uniref:hypothetical protein n=1 Tax=Undibacterium sp. Ji67W TaxID=3413042 RepID=UPI003BF0FC93